VEQTLRVIACALFTLVLAACGRAPSANVGVRLEQAHTAWAENWHAVWQIEWDGAPMNGPLVAEIWHATDGKLRIETLEAPVAALNGLTLVTVGRQAWLYDLRLNQAQSGTPEQVRIPLVDDMLEAMDWLQAQAAHATISAMSIEELESGAATRLEMVTATGDRVIVWLNEQTGLPAGFYLHSGPWGEVKCTTRWLERPARLADALFRMNSDPH
jgi:outer membrane lipoprotein-sorting protein